MTIRQIAEAAGCNHKTVREVAARLYPDKSRNGVRLEFDAHESFAIMAELPKRNLILTPSRKREARLPESGKLPSGAQLREIRLMAEKGKLSRDDLRTLLGLATVKETVEEKASAEVATIGFGQLRLIAEGGSAEAQP